MMEQQAERYPLDFDALAKGQFIPPEQIEAIYAVKRDHKDYQFRCLTLRDEIMREREDLSVRMHKGGLRINTDQEAAAYHATEAQRACNKVRRQAEHLRSRIVRANLEGQQQIAYDREVAINNMRAAILRRKSAKRLALARAAIETD